MRVLSFFLTKRMTLTKADDVMSGQESNFVVRAAARER